MSDLRQEIKARLGDRERLIPSTNLDDLTHQLVETKLGHVAGLFYALHAKHVPTATHCLRVAQAVSAWGESAKLSSSELELIEVAALLHDIGKVGIPDRILQKPSKLNSDEQSVMALHPQIAQEILRAAGASEELMETIRLCGVRFDRLPIHPDGLPFPFRASQFIFIADAYDAMTAEQVYRRPLTEEQALVEIIKNSGSQFQPGLVRSFVEHFKIRASDPNRILDQRLRYDSGNSAILQRNSVPLSFPKVGSMNRRTGDPSLSVVFRNQLLDTMKDAAVFVDLTGQILEWNVAAERMTGLSTQSVLQQSWSRALLDIRNTEGIRIPDLQCPIKSVLHSRTKKTQRLEFLHADGHTILVEVDSVPVFDEAKNLNGAAMFFRDASEKIQLESHVEKLNEKAICDPLTKLANRAELDRYLPEFLKKHHQEKQEGCLIICDIDFFKKINDKHGHPAGDAALTFFASLLKELTRTTDFVARYGGEEFVILCSRSDLASGAAKAEQIRKELANRPVAALQSACMTASFGVSSIEPNDTPKSLLSRADQALLQAKENGRNMVVEFAPSVAPSKVLPNSKTQGGWWSWISAPRVKHEVLHRTSIYSTVALDITIERLRGFIADCRANLKEVEPNFVSLSLESKYLKIPRRDGERPRVFLMQLYLSEVEAVSQRASQRKQIWSVIQIEIQAPSDRDRRKQDRIYQAESLRALFQSYMAAEPLDPKLIPRLQVLQGPLRADFVTSVS